ncbi:MAG TPA: O-antigen ligase family protein [Candidatus Hydrogenedentes bacterium]|nr:O-antigen ligase family protein [Candidatus Hydrogenedentota bacterium]
MAKNDKIRPVASRISEPAGQSADLPWWRAAMREPIALGLGALIVVRPWLDGITYPTDNFYFVWGILLLFTLWASQVLLRGTPIRFGIPILLLSGFWLVAAATAWTTIQFDATYRALIVWGGHLCLFMLACNALRTRIAVGIVLTAFVASSIAETVWSLVHFHYVLPYVRESVMRTPALLKQYFGTTNLSPELVHRLEVNRAFGSLLFPNALAALLVIGIPYAFAGSIHGATRLLRELRSARQTPRGPRASSLSVLLVSGLMWMGVTAIAYFLFSFIATFEIATHPGVQRITFLPLVYDPGSGYGFDRPVYIALWILFVAIPPLIAAGAAARIVQRYGIGMLGRAIAVWTLPPWFLLQLAALWLTYSRGGLMALFAASVTSAVLYFYGKNKPFAPRAAAMAAALILVCAALFSAWHAHADQPGTEQAQAADPGAAQPSPPPIRKEGVDLTMKDLANPASFKLRLGYWKTGLRMAIDNPVIGVGLGCFGFAYPRYQQVGIGDVKAAHNDYLQILCETGLLGFLAFCGFWAWFIWAGARRILRENDAMKRATLAGLYAGLLAFLIHALVDFPFYNPALAFFAFLLAGLFLALSDHAVEGHTAGIRTGRVQVLALPVLAVAALLAGMAARAYLCDYNIGERRLVNVSNHRMLTRLFDVTLFFVKEAGAPQPEGRLPAKEIIAVASLIPDRAMLESFGTIRVPAPEAPGGHRALAPGEPVPENAFFVVTKPAEAKQRALDHIELALARIEEMDAIFPHNPDIATFMVQCYDVLAENVYRPDRKQRYTLEMLKWAREGVRRSPWQPLFHEWLAKAYWLRAGLEAASARRPYYEKGLAEYKTATECYPISASSWRKYGEALIRFGEALQNGIDAAEGESYIAKGRQTLEKAGELERAIASMR